MNKLRWSNLRFSLICVLGCVGGWSLAQDEPNTSALAESNDPISRLETLLDIDEVERVIDETNSLIETIEDTEGYYTEALFQPLVLLGDAEFKRGNYHGALDSWYRAREVSRQIHGLHNLDQTDVLYKEADALYAQEKYSEANDKHEQAFAMYLRVHGEETVETLPGLDRLASWYLDTYNVYAARGLYKDMLKIARSNLTEFDPRTIQALKNLAKTYRMERFRPEFLPPVSAAFKALPYGASISTAKYYPDINNYAPGERALIDVIKLQLEAGDTTIEELTESKLDLADWYLLFEKYQKATVIYKDVWDSLHGTTAQDLLEGEMSAPKQLFLPLPNDPMPKIFSSDTTVLRGEIDLTYSVIPEGKTRDVKIVRSDPGDVIDIAVVSALRKARFRPAFKDREAVRTDGMTYTHRFNFTEEAVQ